MKHFKLIFCAILLLGTAAACTPTIHNRGNMVDDEQLSQLQSGVSNRSDVLNTLGSPTTVAPFHENIWYYIGQETKKKGIFDPKVEEERIVIVTFNKQTGLVDQFGEMDVDRIDLPYNEDTTPSYGVDTNPVRDFFGNLGKFNSPGAAVNQ